MARRKKGRAIDGVVLLDKDYGVSSNDALQRVRRTLDAQKAGHTGSLDPLATGLLPICLGEATKLSSYLLSADKRYRVTADLTGETTTGDLEGEPTEASGVAPPDQPAMRRLLEGFRGRQQQVPPMYSALKVNGRPLYAYAREGIAIERAPRPITVHEIALEQLSATEMTLTVAVSGGTYVRTLIEDIARAWGGRAHLTGLRRIAVGQLGADHAMVSQDTLAEAVSRQDHERWLLPLSVLLAGWDCVCLDGDSAIRFRNGQKLTGADWPDAEAIRVDDEQGQVLGLARIASDGRLAPLRLFARALA